MNTSITKLAAIGTAFATLALATPAFAVNNNSVSLGMVCPDHTTTEVVQTMQVLPNGQNQPSIVLTNGVTYIVQATSTYTFAPDWLDAAGIADAAYSLRAANTPYNSSSSPEWIDGAVFASPYQNYLELWIDDAAVDWGPYNPQHDYSTMLVGTGAAINFSILDSNYGDNSGSLGVVITKCAPVAQYTLSYSAGAHGSVTGSTTQMVYSGEDGEAVTAVANSGYHFVKWSDDKVANPRTDTNVTKNITVTALFAEDAPEPPQPPTDGKNACKNGGWTDQEDSEGNSFRNQGDCVSYHATKGKNKAWNGHDEKPSANAQSKSKGQSNGIGKGKNK